jgi:hypothetical protein
MGKRKNRNDDTVINWQPINNLPTITFIIDGTLHDTKRHYELLLKAKEDPYILDDYTVDRVFSAYTTQRDDISIYDEQLSRWKKEQLDSDQSQEVERLTKQNEELRNVNQRVLSLVVELRKETIDRIM